MEKRSGGRATRVGGLPSVEGVAQDAATRRALKMAYECQGRCGKRDCKKVYRRHDFFERHWAPARRPAAHFLSSEHTSGAPQPDPAANSRTVNTKASECAAGTFTSCVDAAAHLLAALDSSEHMGLEATKRVVELLQPYALALVGQGSVYVPESLETVC